MPAKLAEAISWLVATLVNLADSPHVSGAMGGEAVGGRTRRPFEGDHLLGGEQFVGEIGQRGQHGTADFVGVDLVAGEEQLMRRDVQVGARPWRSSSQARASGPGPLLLRHECASRRSSMSAAGVTKLGKHVGRVPERERLRCPGAVLEQAERLEALGLSPGLTTTS